MRLIAYDAVTGDDFLAWTTENEPDAGLVIIVPTFDRDGFQTEIEVCVGKLGLAAAFGGAK